MSSDHRQPEDDTNPEKGTSEEATVDDGDDASSPSATTTPISAPSASLSAGAWQAIFSPQHNSYYFYNPTTCETTWANPLEPSPSDPSSSATVASDTDANTEADGPSESVHPNPYDPNSLEVRAIAAGIDPSLAHLDPSLAGPSSVGHAGAFSAKFNARTGAFTAVDARAPSHLSEYERMKRMSQFYFDMGAWEKEVEERDEEEKAGGGKKRKRPTKKDLVSFLTSRFLVFIIIAFLRASRETTNPRRNKSSTIGRTY